MILRKMKSKFFELMERWGRKRIVYDRLDNEPYLERYYIFLKDRKRFPFNVFLHRFLKSDPDHVHDHPWPYATLILKGGYYEWRPQFNAKGEKIGEIAKWCGPGHFRVCGANTYHRIEIDPGVECWTLFMPGPQKREWGFLVDNKWMENGTYFDYRKSTR